MSSLNTSKISICLFVSMTGGCLEQGTEGGTRHWDGTPKAAPRQDGRGYAQPGPGDRAQREPQTPDPAAAITATIAKLRYAVQPRRLRSFGGFAVEIPQYFVTTFQIRYRLPGVTCEGKNPPLLTPSTVLRSLCVTVEGTRTRGKAAATRRSIV